MSAWTGRHVVLGVSGGIASYKSCILLRRLVEAGATVDVVMTEGAAEFVRPLTFAALSGRPVLTSLWQPEGALEHVRLAQAAELVIVAPATANLIAKVAQGIGDDLLTTLLLARERPILLAPAMNDAMYANPATQANIRTLTSRGVSLVGPETGPLAEGPSDRLGRMSEPETILAHAERKIRGDGALAGRRILVTGGPTREALDPVRVISNRSSGQMGVRLAEAAWARGAEVVLITGTTRFPDPVGVRVIRIDSTSELEAAVSRELPAADALIMAAAPADYRPKRASQSKLARSEGGMEVAFEPTSDILTHTLAARKSGAVIVGFALETGDAVAKGKAKLERKSLDLVVVNDALEPGAGFEVDTNHVTIIAKDGTIRDVAPGTKREVADAILDSVEARLAR